MRNTGPLKLVAAASVMLAVAAPQWVLPAVFTAIGLDGRRSELLTAWLAPALAGVGFLLLSVGLVWWVRTRAREEAWSPYLAALSGIANEHGRGVAEDAKRGLTFAAVREGQTIDVAFHPTAQQLTVRSRVTARQPLAWIRTNAPKTVRGDELREVGTGRGWEMRAELPALARALLEDPALAEDVSRFFDRPGAVAIMHDRSGIEIVCRAGTADELSALVRAAIEVTFRIRRVNG